tara:strand:+ start:1495 stop:1698 length:204 start_codon:yes stop_codon:yes gene_type:complete
MKRFLLSLSITAIYGISSTINSLDLVDHSIINEDNVSVINDRKLLVTKNENILQEINFESSSEILNN